MRKTKRKWMLTGLLLVGSLLPAGTAGAAGELTVYAAQPFIAVTPGESVTHSVELINETDVVQKATLSVTGLPDGWTYELTSGGKNAREIAVKPDASSTATLDIDVPLQVERGVYRFTLSAGNGNTLPLAVEVTEQGIYETELTTEQPNIEGHADASFTYSASLRNRTAENQMYALRAETPGAGWEVSFTVSGERVSSVDVEAGATETVSVKVTPPQQVEAGTYTIPIVAETSATSATLELQTAIIGRYDIELTTPSGLLSTDVTAGGDKKLELLVKNTGSVELTDVNLSSSTPIDWTVEFEPATIDAIPPGESRTVVATLNAAGAALAGDYALSVTASAPEASSDAQFRVSVKTSVVWGWFGILIIVVVLGGLGYLFRTYGRR
ncbi:NEW3 domain-containing protein [Paenibacillus sp.]|uniref:COG1470 family protein n=1 Tax=Paenibacillus sp. TaxID=58172 RepID=UPI0028128764|nr:NEW3 domain-containing protein [Paenibacillus sp.]